MKKKRIVVGAIAVVVIVGALAWMAQRFGIGKEEKKAGPIPEVQVAKVERKTITEKVIVYGSVVAQPGKTHSVSIAFETRVRHILVAPGQFVRENDPLIEIELSPAAQVQFQQAQNAAEAARKELKQTQERFNLKLATNQDLSAAVKTARDAEAQLSAPNKTRWSCRDRPFCLTSHASLRFSPWPMIARPSTPSKSVRKIQMKSK